MNEFLLFFLPASIIGALFIFLWQICTPFTKKLKSKQQRSIILLGSCFFIFPFYFLGNGVVFAVNNFTTSKNIETYTATHAASVEPIYKMGSHMGNMLKTSLPNLANPTQEKTSFSIIKILFFIYIIIGLVLFFIKMIHYFKFRKNILIQARPLPENLKALYKSICIELGITKKVPIAISSFTTAPLLCGVFKPCIYLPNENISSKTFENIVKHELTHYKHHDIIAKFFIFFISILHWFNPFVYVLIHKFEDICEYACDEAVVQNFNKNAYISYAKSILQFVDIQTPHTITHFSSYGKKLQERLENFMIPQNHSKKRKYLSISAISLGVIILLFTGATFAFGAKSSNSENITINDTHDVTSENSSEIFGIGKAASNAENFNDNLLCTILISPMTYQSSSPIFTGNEYRGIQLYSQTDTFIYPITDGTVVTTKQNDPELGNYIKIDHENGLQAIYAQLDTIQVQEGQYVDMQDTVIGTLKAQENKENFLYLEVQEDNLPINIELPSNLNDTIDWFNVFVSNE